jgi:hypothetical protein
VADLEEEIEPLREGNRAPGAEGLLGGRDGGVDFLDGGEVDRPGLIAGSRVVDRAAAPGLSGDAAASDPVVDGLDGCGCLDQFGHAIQGTRLPPWP